MRVLASPVWSFGRDRRLLFDCRDALDACGVVTHYAESDIDHNRTVTAFSGDGEAVGRALLGLCDLVLPSIDLGHHVSQATRLGALDLCPLTLLAPPKTRARERQAQEWVSALASSLSQAHAVPVFLSDKSESGRAEAELPLLRAGGFGGLVGQELRPDFGPTVAHPHLGVTFIGLREFQLNVSSVLAANDPHAAAKVAHKVTVRRDDGDPRLLGVKAKGFLLPSREQSHVCLRLTLPDVTPLDPVLEFINESADVVGTEVVFHEVVGAIRDRDMEHATLVHPRREQVVPFRVPV